jgi:hypothetical protein
MILIQSHPAHANNSWDPNNSQDPISKKKKKKEKKKPLHKRDGGGVVQGVGPEFKPQYH